jgi:hypothetical protein
LGNKSLKSLSPVDLLLWKLKWPLNPFRNLLSIPTIYLENGVANTVRDKASVFSQHLSSLPESFTTTREEGPRC